MVKWCFEQRNTSSSTAHIWFRLTSYVIEEATSEISTTISQPLKIVFRGVLEMLLLVISIVCWRRLVTVDAGFQSSKSSIYAFCWLALPLNMLIVDPSISAFTATRHHTWQSTYTSGRQFAAAVFVSLWVDGQCLLVVILRACWWTSCSWMLSSTLA